MKPIDSFLSELVQISADSSLSKIAVIFRERRIHEVFLPEGQRCGIICARDFMKASNNEATKAKFRRIVNQLRRVFPDILEARSVIKSKFSRPGKERGRYEVTVQIRTSNNPYTYSEEGWDLPAVYDVLTDRLKRLMTQKQKSRGQHGREREKIP